MEQFDEETRNARKLGAYIPVTDEQLMDAGAIPDTRPTVRIPWRYRRWARWIAARERAGEIIAGRTFDDDYDL